MSYAIAVCVSPVCVIPRSLCVKHTTRVIQYHILSFCHFQELSFSLALLSVIRESSAGAVLPHHVCCTQKLCVAHRSPLCQTKPNSSVFAPPTSSLLGTSSLGWWCQITHCSRCWTDKHNMNINERQVCKEFYQYNGVAPRRRDEITLSPHYQRLIRVIGRGGPEERSLDVDKLRGAVGGELL